MLIKSLIYAAGIAMILLVSACSSHIPPEIKQPLDGIPTIEQIRNQADAHLSTKVRWGGIILSTENKRDTSWVTIVAFPLNDDGRPQVDNQSTGRFIAVVDQFLEPLVYSNEREITVVGSVLKTEMLKVGEFPYEYPVIQADHYYLWPPKPELREPVYLPYWYDPYYPWHYPYYSPRYMR